MNYQERKNLEKAKGVTLLTSKQVAQRLAVSMRTVQYMANDGRLTVVKIGKSTRFYPADIDLYIAKNTY